MTMNGPRSLDRRLDLHLTQDKPFLLRNTLDLLDEVHLQGQFLCLRKMQNDFLRPQLHIPRSVCFSLDGDFCGRGAARVLKNNLVVL
jgi:hypothetical protein